MKSFKKAAISLFMAAVMACSTPISGFCAITGFDSEAAAETYVNIEGTMIYYEEDVSEEDREEAVTAWLMLPENIREGLVKYGVKIYVTSSAEADSTEVGVAVASVLHMSSGEIVGISDTPYIIAMTQSPDLTGTILHECGHMVDTLLLLMESDMYYGTMYVASECDEWAALYEAYSSALSAIDRNAGIDSVEAFAVAFRETYEDTEWFSANFPEMYGYVVRISESIGNGDEL